MTQTGRAGGITAGGDIPALTVDHLSIAYETTAGLREVLSDVSFTLERGGSLGLIGESGCGKSTLAAALVAYLPANARILGGQVLLGDEPILSASPARLRELRAARIGMVAQDAASALNPSMRLGAQVVEAIRACRKVSRAEAEAQTLEVFQRVRLNDPERVMRRYPHEISGGQQQRVFIAMALAANPDIIVFDEPTTGLDASVESDVLDLIDDIRRSTGTSMIFISHNLGLVARVCETVGVLYAGRIVEYGDARTVLGSPGHPYTEALTRCVPGPASSKTSRPLQQIPGTVPADISQIPGCRFAERCALAVDRCRAEEPELEPDGADHAVRCFRSHELPTPAPRATAAPVATAQDAAGPEVLLSVEHVVKRYGRNVVLKDVSLQVNRGEILGLVGESGSGKSTLARVIAGLVQPDAGSVTLAGERLRKDVGARTPQQLRAVQMVYQNPDGTLNPRVSIGSALARAIAKLRGRRSVATVLEEVSIGDHYRRQTPQSLSGGQKQRVAIARAFAGEPSIVLADEPVSALDSSVQAGVLALLSGMQREHDVSMLFVSHDIGVVRYLSDRLIVMYQGEIVEEGPTDEVFANPRHPYTRSLLDAARASSLASQTGSTTPAPAASGSEREGATR